jgi:hypothetical protein
MIPAATRTFLGGGLQLSGSPAIEILTMACQYADLKACWELKGTQARRSLDFVVDRSGIAPFAEAPTSTPTLHWSEARGSIQMALENLEPSNILTPAHPIPIRLHVKNVAAVPMSVGFRPHRSDVFFGEPEVGPNERWIEDSHQRFNEHSIWFDGVRFEPGQQRAFDFIYFALPGSNDPPSSPSLTFDLPDVTTGKWEIRYRTDMLRFSDLESPRASGTALMGFVTGPVSINVDNSPPDSPSTAWGPAVNWLRARIELVPEKKIYAKGEIVGVKFHLQNVGREPIRFYGPPVRSDSLIINASAAEAFQVNDGYALLEGRSYVDRTIEPGATVVVDHAPLAIVGPGLAREQLSAHTSPRIGSAIDGPTGSYSVEYEIAVPQIMAAARPGTTPAWRGTVTTGRRLIEIVRP